MTNQNRAQADRAFSTALVVDRIALPEVLDQALGVFTRVPSALTLVS